MVYHTAGPGIVTPDDFLHHPAANDRTELVRGHIQVMTPASAAHGLVSGTVFHLLASHVRQHKLGACFADSTGYTLPNLPNTVRAPDASFVRRERLPANGVGAGFLEMAPDLAVEVLSPNESREDIAAKLADYRVAGTPLVWVIDPAARTVTVISATEDDATVGESQRLSGGSTLPGFTCSVRDLFEGLAAPLTPPSTLPTAQG